MSSCLLLNRFSCDDEAEEVEHEGLQSSEGVTYHCEEARRVNVLNGHHHDRQYGRLGKHVIDAVPGRHDGTYGHEQY